MKNFTFLLISIAFLFGNLSHAQKEVSDDQKYVVIEEHTGAWCQWCPRGTVKGRQLSQQYDNVIFVAIHSTDPMSYPEYLTATGLSAAPTANIQRKFFDQDTGEWEGKVISETSIDAPAYLEIITDYNESNRELEAEVTVHFTEDYSGSLNLAGLIVEDAVTGPSPGFDQSNSYSGGGNGPMGGFEDLPSPVPANMIAYDHLSRQLLGGYDGLNNIIPSSVSAGESFSNTFTHILPDDYNWEYIRVTAWIIDNNNGHIVNAGKSNYLGGNDNAFPHFITNPVTEAFVGIQYNYMIYTADPETDGLTISATDLPDWLSLNQTAQNTVHTAGILNGVPTETGTFPITLTVNDGQNTTEQTFEIIVESNPGAGWEVIGEEGFSDMESSNNILRINDEDVPYVAIFDYGSALKVMKYENDEWISVGSSIGTPDSHFGFDIDNEGTPWIAFNDISNGTKCIVRKFDGNSWVNAGDAVSVGAARNVYLECDNNGIPHVAFYEQTMNTQGFVYKYENTEWQMLGDGPIDPGVALFFDIKFNEQNTPYLLWSLAPSGYSFYSRVSKFENNEWSEIGGGDISENTTYFQHSLAINSENQIAVSLCETSDNQLNTYLFTGSEWEKISPEGLTGEYVSLEYDNNDELFWGFQNSAQGSQTSVMKYDGTNWTSVGPATISGTSKNQSLGFNNNNEPYIAYSDEDHNGFTTVKAYLASETAIAVIDPLSIEFPETIINETSEETIMISNTGTVPLEITNINSNNYIFNLSEEELTIEPGASTELIVSFSPEAVEWYEGIVSMETNDPYNAFINIEVSGQGRLLEGMNELNSQFRLYPNPATDMLKILSDKEMTQIQIYNTNGQIIMNTPLNSLEINIDLKKFNKGVYIVRIVNNENSSIQKLIIQ